MSTWTIRRVGDMARLINGHPFDSDDFTPTGDVPLVRIRDITAADFETYVPQHTVPQDKVLKDGDVVIGMDGDFNVIRWRRGTAALNQRVCALRDTGVSDLRFLAYALPDHLKVINDLTYSTTVKHLSSGQVTGLRITAPDRDDQGRIADYLDRETATIDALIEKQRALVAGLRRRRVAAIVAATSGMQANGDRGESASSWLKYMPAHWSELPIKRILTDVQSGYWGSDEVGDGTDVRVVRVADFDRPTLSVGTAPTIRSVTPSERAKAALRRGDLLMEKSGGTGINPVGFVVSYESDEESIFANFIVRLRPRPDQHARFWLYALNGAYTSGLTWKSVNQTTGIQNLDMASFMSELFPVPPLDEQREIADHLDRETAKIDALIAKAERFIELAQERRAALITAAVTGQLEIPTED
ncbi:restriction endonuclease subunit S [Micrococcus luteus]|uniref:restriction endonuclease subunit S n=1 Tax=Micrococcus luteus TaxID=1270 RepID=UPI0034087749